MAHTIVQSFLQSFSDYRAVDTAGGRRRESDDGAKKMPNGGTTTTSSDDCPGETVRPRTWLFGAVGVALAFGTWIRSQPSFGCRWGGSVDLRPDVEGFFVTDPSCVLLPVTLLRPTEETVATRVREVVAMILADQTWTQPICIEGTVCALLDGHHRLAAAQELGLVQVPVHVFDYVEVELLSWRPDITPTRNEVLSRALSGKLYPHKTTRHVFPHRHLQSVPLAALK